MTIQSKYRVLTYSIAIVWVTNGLFCKVLNFVPRHQLIVERILGEKFAAPLTIAIGLSEIAMAVWIVVGLKYRLNAIAQILIVASMNIIEFVMAEDLLLWGKLNAFFALLFVLVIYYTEFVLRKQIHKPI